MWKYMGRSVDPQTLPTMAEALAFIEAECLDEYGLSSLRDKQEETHGFDMIWRYPLSVDKESGAFILPVREGILWVPYDAMSEEDGEHLMLEDASLLDADACRALLDDLRRYADQLCSMLTEASYIAKQNAANASHTNQETC